MFMTVPSRQDTLFVILCNAHGLTGKLRTKPSTVYITDSSVLKTQFATFVDFPKLAFRRENIFLSELSAITELPFYSCSKHIWNTRRQITEISHYKFHHKTNHGDKQAIWLAHLGRNSTSETRYVTEIYSINTFERKSLRCGKPNSSM
jgi:hypothetical protein